MILTFGDDFLTNRVSTLCPLCFVLCVSQPLCDVFCLQRAVPWVQVTIEQIGNFVSGAWFPDLV
jgi:hypothetical protein